MKYKIFQSSPWIDGVEKKFLLQTIKNNWITEGPLTRRFLLRVKKITKSKHVELAPNGTLGLYLALKALNLPKNSEVIVPNFTFYASASSVIFAGLIPKFVDVNMDDFNMNHNNLEKLIKKQTKAIMIVHAYGQSARMKEIISIAKKYKLKIIEDAAQVFNVFYNKKHCGTLGDVGVISFYGDKSLTTGEGAAILTQNKKIAKRIKFLRNQGRENSGTFKHKEIGMNFRMTDLQCAIGLGQLSKINKIKKERNLKYKKYISLLRNVKHLSFLKINDKKNFIPFRFCILTKNKNELVRYLEKNKIQTRSFFYPLSLQPKLKKYKNDKGENAKRLYDTGICLPIHHLLENKDINYICNKIKKFFQKKYG